MRKYQIASVLALAGLIVWIEAARAQAEMVRLDQSNLAYHAAETQALGVAPGDVLVSNAFLKAVLKATVDGDAGSVGRAIIWHGLPAGAVQWRPGLEINWTSAEVGSNDNVVVVRYRHAEPQWQADLVYKLFDNSPWLDVTLTIANRHPSRTLEIPASFQLLTAAEADVDQKDGVLWVTNGENGVAAAMLASAPYSFEKRSKGDWIVGAVSGDPEPSAAKRVTRRLPLLRRFASDPTLRPIDVSREWPRQARDRSNWFRIEPGQQRTAHWKVVVGAGAEHTGSLVEFAKTERLPEIQLAPQVRAGSPQPQAPRQQTRPQATAPVPPRTAADGQPDRIVGTIRGQQRSSGQAAPTPAPRPQTDPPARSSSNFRPAQPSEGPALLPDSFDQIPDLPLPID